MHPRPRHFLSIALMGLALSSCKPQFTSDVLFKPYHDPFDTSPAAGFSEIPAQEVQPLLKILERSTRTPWMDTSTSYGHVAFLPYGTVALHGKSGDTLTCICFRRKLECDSLHEFVVDSADIATYRDLMLRIDSLDRARRGLPRRVPPPVSTPDVPIN
jgi:hypothetical protein